MNIEPSTIILKEEDGIVKIIRDAEGVIKKKRGRPPKQLKFPPGRTPDPNDLATAKSRVLAMLACGQAKTPTEAAQILDLPPLEVRRWIHQDKKFNEDIKLAREVFGDWLISELAKTKHPVAKIFLTKAVFPEYKDNYKSEQHNPVLENLLTELLNMAKAQTKVESLPKVEIKPEEVVIPMLTDQTTCQIKEA
jgi:hypothetical protein